MYKITKPNSNDVDRKEHASKMGIQTDEYTSFQKCNIIFNRPHRVEICFFF